MTIVRIADDACVNTDEVQFVMKSGPKHTRIVFRHNDRDLTVPSPFDEVAKKLGRVS